MYKLFTKMSLCPNNSLFLEKSHNIGVPKNFQMGGFSPPKLLENVDVTSAFLIP